MAGFDPNSNEITTDPEYLQLNPGYIKQAHDLLVQYGIIPPPNSGFGSDSATADEVAANPYSVAAMLRKGYQTNLGSNMNQANTHGALFSGAYVNNQAHSLQDFTKGLSDATTQLQQGLSGIGTARGNTLIDIWKRLSAPPVVPDLSTAPTPAAPTPGPPPGAASGPGTNYPTPQGPYQRTGPEAGGKVTKPKPVSYAGRAL